MITRLPALLPLISMTLFFLILHKKGSSLRHALLIAAVIWGVAITAITEGLSVFHALDITWLSISWCLVLVSLSGIYLHVKGIDPPHSEYRIDPFNKLLLLCIAVIVITTGIISLIAPPNNYDSMAYHMSRIMHWIQNQSVDHYPTSIINQIQMNPWAEFAIANFQILSGGDRFANLIQWFSMFGCIIGVGLIAEKFGASLTGQIFTSVFAATIPMGILQSSSTQNDCVLAFWLVCIVYFGILFNETPCRQHASAVGASLGLALLTKGTAYIFAFPLLIWLAVTSLRRIKLKSLKYISLAIVIAISLNAGHWVRNYGLFGNFLSADAADYSNDHYYVSHLVSNIIRNISLELGSPSAYANAQVKSVAHSLHRILGLDIKNQETTWKNEEFTIGTAIHEDSIGSPLHLALILFTIPAFLFRRGLKNKPNALQYILALSIAFMCFCLYLKWQPWHCRLLLPLVILWSPIISMSIVDFLNPQIAKSIPIISVVFAIPFLLFNSSRPILNIGSTKSILITDRISQYFNNYASLMPKYFDIARHIRSKNCSNIALETGEFSWEYPLWVLLQQEFEQRVNIEHVNVHNRSKEIPLKYSNHCELVSLDRGVPWIGDYKWGAKLNFSSRNLNDMLYLIQGWSNPEKWGVWSVGEKATVAFRAPEPSGDMALALGDLRFFAGQSVTLLVNGEAAYDFSNLDAVKEIVIPLSKTTLTKKSPITIEFLTPQSSSPLSLGIGMDTRKLGVGLGTLAIMPKEHL